MRLINGKPQDCIDASDRGVQYGDGVFTTILVKLGVVESLPRHLSRLQKNATVLGIEGIDWPNVSSWIDVVSQSTVQEDLAVMKVIITRGAGGRGYSPEGCNVPTIIISSHPYPPHYLEWKASGIDVELLSRRIGLSPLAGLKHLNRLEQVLLKRDVEVMGVDDGVVCDMEGYLVETSASNLFWRKGQALYTPKLDKAGVAGTMRARVIQTAGLLGFELVECYEQADTLETADEIFITNAVMEMVPVRRFGNKKYNDFVACRAISLRLIA